MFEPDSVVDIQSLCLEPTPDLETENWNLTKNISGNNQENNSTSM